MKYFLFAMFFMMSANNIFAQGFFVPNGAFSSTQERLKPLDENTERQLSRHSQRRYKVIDGRVYALDNIVEDDSQNNGPEATPSADNHIQDTAEEQTLNTPAPEPVISAEPQPFISAEPQPSTEQNNFVHDNRIQEQNNPPELQSNLIPPQKDLIKTSDPLYKKRYNMYLSDLEQFQRTKKMPRNNELEDTLQQLSQKREITLFQGVLD